MGSRESQINERRLWMGDIHNFQFSRAVSALASVGEQLQRC